LKKKILLIGINARWTHSNPALFYLRTYVKDLNYDIQISEYTINQTAIEIISDIYKINPDIIAFSVYIWNSRIVQNLLKDINKVLSRCKIVLGGPEVSYHPQDWLDNFNIDHIICGNGESGFRELLLNEFDPVLKIIKKESPPFEEVPFPYLKSDKETLRNKYLYYEASRGCAFKCSYCLSSRIDQKLSYRRIEQIKIELDSLMVFNPKIIKFVDRTFNANSNISQSIWEFLIQKNLSTKFHFEIHPALLNDKDFQILKKVQPDRFQFEIGIQTFNTKTLKEINRKIDINVVTSNTEKLIAMQNIHIHLDLITGLPFEDIVSFQKSFDIVYKMRPDHFQLGFLKVLDGTEMKENVGKYALKYQSESPYMILSNKWMGFHDIIKVHEIEKLLEIYYNSGKFRTTLFEVQKLYSSPFEFFSEFSQFISNRNLEKNSMVWIKSAKIINDFIEENHIEHIQFFRDCLRWDWCKIAKSHYFPDFLDIENNKSLKKQQFQNLKAAFNKKHPDYNSSLIKRAIYFESFSKRFSDDYLIGKKVVALINNNSSISNDLKTFILYLD